MFGAPAERNVFVDAYVEQFRAIGAKVAFNVRWLLASHQSTGHTFPLGL